MTSLTWLKLGLLAVAGIGSYFGAVATVDFVEMRKRAAVMAELEAAGLDWVSVQPDGMRIVLGGTAPDEAARFRAITVAGRATNPTHLRDDMAVPPPEDMPLLAFKAEMMRNGDTILLLGLVPEPDSAEMDLVQRARAIAPGMEVSDILTRSLSTTPEHWPVAAEIGLAALADLENVRVEIRPDAVRVEGIAPQDLDAQAWTEGLKARAPDAVSVEVTLRQPRQRLSPFTMQLVNDGDGVRIASCAVEHEKDAERLSKALMAQGGAPAERCRIALGAPDAAWPDVAEAAIRSLAALGSGAITISDRSVTVLPDANVTADALAAEGEALREVLPDSYELSLLQTKGLTIAEGGGPRLSLSRSPNGAVMLSGPVPSAQDQAVLASLAVARFGSEQLTRIISIDSDLPATWGLRAMAATEALALLRDGDIEVTEDLIAITGTATRPNAADTIAAQLIDRLGPETVFTLDIAYEAPVEQATAVGPTPRICVTEINAILLESKITFAPGAVELGEDALQTVDRIADVLRECPDTPMEIGGHTDSQGSEEMNQLLSQARAEAVLAALAKREILTGQLSAKGYGETEPIADNSTEAGREANRRIAFRLTSSTTDDTQGSVDGSE